MIIALVGLLLAVLLFIGMPVGFALAVSGAAGLWLMGGTSLLMGILDTAPLSSVASYELITIPMFILMAEFVILSGVADDLFKAAATWVGRVPGGLGIATAFAGAGFGAGAIAAHAPPTTRTPRSSRAGALVDVAMRSTSMPPSTRYHFAASARLIASGSPDAMISTCSCGLARSCARSGSSACLVVVVSAARPRSKVSVLSHGSACAAPIAATNAPMTLTHRTPLS